MTHPAPTPQLRAALDAASRGWHVFPLIPGRKRPAVRAWEQQATTDPHTISRVWGTAPYNIGIAAGPSRLVIVDLDVPKHDADRPPEWAAPRGTRDGRDAFTGLCTAAGEPVPDDTYQVRTPSGGTHLYYAAPSSVRLRNTAGTLGWKVDTRAAGGYVVGAGSTVHTRLYEAVHDIAPARLPHWLTQLLAPPPRPPEQPVTVAVRGSDRRSRYLNAAIDGERQRITAAPAGERNTALYIAACALGQLVAGGELTSEAVHDALTPTAEAAGLTTREIAKTIRSGLRSGAKRPRSFRPGDAA